MVPWSAARAAWGKTSKIVKVKIERSRAGSLAAGFTMVLVSGDEGSMWV